MRKFIQHKYIMLVALLLLATTACEQLEDTLGEKTYSVYDSDVFFETEKQAYFAVLGVYETMADLNTYGRMTSMFADADTDEQMVEGTVLAEDRRQICHYEASPSLSYVQLLWARLYNGIDRANQVIERIPQMDVYANGSDTQKASLNRMLGEAKFLRAIFYFDLVRIYGAVPLKLKSTKLGDDLFLPRASYDELYNQMDKDLTEAAEVIPWQSQIPVLDERASKGAVLGYQARINLHRGGFFLNVFTKTKDRAANYKEYYQKALVIIKQIMDSKEHALNPSYEQIFRNQCALIIEPKEDMFQVALYNPVDNASNNTGQIGFYNSTGGTMRCVLALYDSFAPTDPRRAIAIATFKANKGAANTDYFDTKFTKSSNWTSGKWRQNWHAVWPDFSYTNINWVLLRYTDIVLMRAEIENELNEGPNEAAYSAINSIRTRSALTPYATGMTKSQFFTAIVNERSWELCFEGWRKTDLIRWNLLGEKVRWAETRSKQLYSKFPYIAGTYYQDLKDELWPIPQREITENPNMTQNPGY